MTKILCPIDFSQGAREALRTAVDVAKSRDAELVLLHVDEPPLWEHEPYVRMPGDVRRSREDIEPQLATWKREAIALGAKSVETMIARGAAWDEISGLARRDETIAMIVMGTHGRTGLARAMIGSVAERVVRHAPCSVMVVRSRS